MPYTVTFWGTRGSIPTPGAATARYGGNTPCVVVEGAGGQLVVLDAGTGIRRLGMTLNGTVRRVDLLLTHLHMDHLQGLGFFDPLFNPAIELHIDRLSGKPGSAKQHAERNCLPDAAALRHIDRGD